MLSENQKLSLLQAARSAVAKAFLTKDGGVCYGAAVLTSSGQIHGSGQYSSFNHSTNVHAEQGALVLAAMAGDADVLALAVASTGRDGVTRPCGVCRQVMLEHATRTGRDFLVLMASPGGWEESLVSELLPHAWVASSQKSNLAEEGSGRPAPSGGRSHVSGETLQTGDHVRLRGGLLALVWDPNPWPGNLLVKLKYRDSGAAGWHKFFHAFSQPYSYEQELEHYAHLVGAPCGGRVAMARGRDIEEVFRLALAPALPPVFAACLREAGIDLSAVSVTGSQTTGMADGTSDLDLVVRADVGQAASLRAHLAEALRKGELSVPASSGTWAVLSKLYPGGREAILDRSVFAETFEENGLTMALMLVPPGSQARVHGESARFGGLVSRSGVVVDATRALYKRAEFSLHCPAHGNVRVVSYHKAANLVCAGDQLAVRGWLVEDDAQPTLLQFHRHRENIIWFPNPIPNP